MPASQLIRRMAKVCGEAPQSLNEGPPDRIIANPSYFQAYQHLFTGDFLTLRDHEAEGSFDQFIGENTNLALICALLVTTFLPLYYSEAERLTIPDDGLTIDIAGSFFNMHILKVGKTTLHEFFDITYLMATGGMFFGTLSCVYLILMANEAGNDERLLLFRQKLGVITRFPYYCFTIGAISWGVSIICHILLIPRQLAGFVVKSVLIFSLIGAFAVWFLPISTMALYSTFHDVQKSPPKKYTEDELRKILDRYIDATDKMELDLDDYLVALRAAQSAHGYRPPLSTPVKFRAAQLYYRRLEQVTDMPLEHLLSIAQLIKG